MRARGIGCSMAMLLFAAHASAQPPEAEHVARTPDATPTASVEATARTPKVAIVIAGDPDPAAVTAAQALEARLASDPRVTMPSDPAVRAALRGAGSSDGLDDLRSERRRLGLGEARDIGALTVLGEITSADLVLVVRASHGAVHASAFDVLRRSFYDGEVTLEPLDTAVADFVVRRAVRAARPLEDGETTNPPVTTTAPVVDPSTAVPPEAIAADPAQPPHERDFFEQYWPYFAAGALVIGAVVFIVLSSTSGSTPPPVLRFVGGS